MKKAKTHNRLLPLVILLLLATILGFIISSCTRSEGRDIGGTIWGNTRSSNIPDRGLGNGMLSVDNENIYAITKKDGYFSIRGIPEGNHTVTLTKFGQEIYSAPISTSRGALGRSLMNDPGRNPDSLTLFEFPVGVPGEEKLQATILDKDQNPVVGAEIDLIYQAGGYFWVAETDVAGSFYLENLPANPDLLMIDAPGFNPAVFDSEMIATFIENSKEDQGAILNLIPLELDKPAEGTDVGSMSGVLKDETGNVLAGIKVALYPKNSELMPILSVPKIIETNDLGEYSFADIPIGNYVIWVGHPNFFPVQREITIEKDTSLPLDLTLNAACDSQLHPLYRLVQP